MPDQVLLAASDVTRQGALRFRTEQDGPHLADDNVTIPKVLDMETLLDAAREVASDPNTNDWAAVQRLLETGTSALGGARPKAAIDDDGVLWLAKFPKIGDENDVPLWEIVALDIAERAGLEVPERRLLVVGGRHVLLVRRFDRTPDGQRRAYISARTLLNARDLGVVGDYEARNLGNRLRRESINPKRDLELWVRQAALNLLVNNTDNHLRNHGLLREGKGWTLAPVFDLDPNPDTGTEFQTHFGGAAYRGAGLGHIVGIAMEFGIDERQARRILDDVHQAASDWGNLARSYGATEAEIELFTDAFTGLTDKVRDIITPVGSTGTG